MKSCSPAALFAGLCLAAPAAAASAAPDECAALNHLFRLGRSEFPQLAHEDLSPGRCSLRSQQFKCRWGFAGDRFASAQEQASRLARCTAAEPHARQIKGKGGETAYQLNPETSVFIRGPEMDSGEWAITLKIVTSANWK